MTTLTQIWMTLLLSNILPSDHNSDLPLPKCQLVYAILTQVSVHVAQLIFGAIYQFAGIASTRHPVDPEKSNKDLGFPALITGLYQFYRVPVAPSKGQAQAQGQAPQQPGDGHQQAVDDTPPLPPESTSTHLRRLERCIRHVADQQAANHRGQVRLNESFYQYTIRQQGQDSSPYTWPTP